MSRRTLQIAVLTLLLMTLVAPVLFQPKTEAQSEQGVPVFQITPVLSKITFHVSASVKIEGTFEKWDSTLTFTSADVSTGHLDIKIQADSVNTGSKSKDAKMKGQDCFDAEHNPYITFHSTKIVQTGPYTFNIPGTFTLRGISKTESLTLTVNKAEERSGTIEGALAIDRRDYGLSGNVPFVKIDDRVDVTVALKAKRVSGPALLK
jgi:polyisoprenoid-binding protein YceI